MGRLTVSVLRDLEVQIDRGKVQEFESDKVRALLVYLIVSVGDAIATEIPEVLQQYAPAQ